MEGGRYVQGTVVDSGVSRAAFKSLLFGIKLNEIRVRQISFTEESDCPWMILGAAGHFGADPQVLSGFSGVAIKPERDSDSGHTNVLLSSYLPLT